MGEHKTNPVALGNRVPTKTVQALDVGEGFALLGLQLVPVLDESRENLVVLLVGIGGRQSDLVPTDPHPVPICELAKAPLASLRMALAGRVVVSSAAQEDGAPDAPTDPGRRPEQREPAPSPLVVIP